jgi:hypothetical protein
MVKRDPVSIVDLIDPLFYDVPKALFALSLSRSLSLSLSLSLSGSLVKRTNFSEALYAPRQF